MALHITIFDIEEQPLSNQPVELLQNGQVISEATTDALGVANFTTTFASAPDLTIRSRQH